MAELAVGRPVLDPASSLGWRSGPLDGLSCLLRCVESVLRAQGFGPREMACALALPLDLTGERREPARFRHGRLDWHNAVDGTEHWAELTASVRAGTPVILMPDRYYWPGDEFEGRRHFLDHMVLVVEATESELEVLDTDAPADTGYVRRITVTDQVIRSSCRFATVHIERTADTAQTLRATLLEPMARWLAEDLPTIEGFVARWESEGLTGPMARALHVLVLGELQPNLFLTGLAVRETFPATAEAAARAAAAAQVFGLAVLGAHRYAGEQAYDTSVYRPVVRPFRAAQAALADFVTVLHDELGIASVKPGSADDRLWDRLTRMQAWCFAEDVAAPYAVVTTKENDR